MLHLSPSPPARDAYPAGQHHRDRRSARDSRRARDWNVPSRHLVQRRRLHQRRLQQGLPGAVPRLGVNFVTLILYFAFYMYII